MPGESDNTTLIEQAQQALEHEGLREAVERHLDPTRQLQALHRLSMSVPPGDQMLEHSLRHHGDAHAALSQYFNVALQQYHAARQVIELLFGNEANSIRVLDFACGYGRLLRFLSLDLPLENICGSDIQPGALEYVEKTFGVQTMPSTAVPEAFEAGGKFHLIWVASLFSHLPEPLFHRWIRRLLEYLEPGGVLCFSAHDEAILPDGLSLPEDGILFLPESEDAALDTEIYGTTFVSEEFVAAAVTHVTGANRRWHRIPRGLAHEQDIYVVAGSEGTDLSALQRFRHGPWGWADTRQVSADGSIRFDGWAGSLDEEDLREVQVLLDGVEQQVQTGLPRQDVAEFFGLPRLAASGWAFHSKALADRESVELEISAVTNRGERALIYYGVLTRPD